MLVFVNPPTGVHTVETKDLHWITVISTKKFYLRNKLPGQYYHMKEGTFIENRTQKTTFQRLIKPLKRRHNSFNKYRWSGSNRHSRRNTILSRARLPIPPHRHK